MKYFTNKAVGIATVLFATLTFSHCGDDESVATVTYSIDGDKQKVLTVTAILQTSTDYDHEGRALNITAANGTSKMLSIAVSNWDFQNPPENGVLEKTYDATFDYESGDDNGLANCLELTDENVGVFLCEGALITYIGESDIFFSAFDGNTQATVTITKCNTSKKTVSGSFMAKVQNFDEDEYTITGEFSDVKYSVF